VISVRLSAAAGLAALLAMGGAARAADPCARGLPGVVAGFRQLKSLRASFTEEKHIALLARPLVTKGSIFYRAPTDLIRRTGSPRPSAVWLHGTRLRFKDDSGEKEMDLGRWGPAQSLVDSYLHVLGGDLDWLKAHYTVDFQCRAGAWRVALAPREPALAKLVTSITLSGSGDELSRVEVVEASGDRTETTYSASDRSVDYGPADLEKLYRDAMKP
jgi:hypothetical protein